MGEAKLKQIIEQISSEKRPPVESWKPSFTGELDMRIAINGDWYYQGSIIRRLSLVKLFSTILIKEDDDYFMVTPVEKYKITVEDAPFIAVEVDRYNDTKPIIVFRTNVDDKIILDMTHPLTIKHNPKTKEPRPYITVRHNLKALISRNVFYQLVQWGEESMINNKRLLILKSGDHEISLGELD